MAQQRPSISDKRRAFRKLHESGCFLIPNPWDSGSARYLQSLGFKALATTSSGSAWSQARSDGGLSRERVLGSSASSMVAAHRRSDQCRFRKWLRRGCAGVGESVRLAVQTGVAGLSIEDSTGNAAAPLFELDVAVGRVRAARRAIDEAGADTMLIARAECFLVGHAGCRDDDRETQGLCRRGRRLPVRAGRPTIEHIRAVVAAAHPKPVNLLVSSPGELTLATDRGSRGAPRERGGRAGARRVGRLHACGPRTRRARHFRRPRERGLRQGTRHAVQCARVRACGSAWCWRNRRPRSASSTKPRLMRPQHSAPTAQRHVLPLNCRPITAPTRAPPKVEMNPCKRGADARDRAHRLHRHGAEVGHRQAEARHRGGLQHDEGPQLLGSERGEHDVQRR